MSKNSFNDPHQDSGTEVVCRRPNWKALCFVIASLLIATGGLYDKSALRAQEQSGPAGQPWRKFLKAGVYRRHITVDDRDRFFICFVPSWIDVSAPTPVLLSFHGGGGSARLSADLDEKFGGAGYVILYPDGTDHTWNAGPGPDGHSPNYGKAFAENVDDVKFTNTLLDELAKVVNVDQRRIYATGVSNGSAMSYRLACELSNRVAAVGGVVSELSLPTCAPPRPVPIIHFWGTADPIQRAGASSPKDRAYQTIESWARIDKCSEARKVTYQRGEATCVTQSQCASGAEVTLCTVVDMGHRTPGQLAVTPTNERNATRILGPGSDDLDATEMMIDFFHRHPMPESQKVK